MFSDDRFQHFLGDVGTFDDDLVAHHYGRGHRQVQFKIGVGHVVFFGAFRYLDFNFIGFAQPGQNFLKVLSRLAIRNIHKKSDFQHAHLLIMNISIASDRIFF